MSFSSCFPNEVEYQKKEEKTDCDKFISILEYLGIRFEIKKIKEEPSTRVSIFSRDHGYGHSYFYWFLFTGENRKFDSYGLGEDT